MKLTILNLDSFPRSASFHFTTAATLTTVALILLGSPAHAQDAVETRIDRLSASIARVQSQLEQSQRDLHELQKQLADLRSQKGMQEPPAPEHEATEGADRLAAAVAEIQEHQAIDEAEIATHDQEKVESQSKYPVKISGMILVSSFINTSGVDSPTNPTAASQGGGTTGASLRQSILGIDAFGPHLFKAATHGDVRVDLDGTGSTSTTYSSGYNSGLVRLRTAHAELDWDHAQAFFSLDRPLISPMSPESLTAVAVPALSWSGNLWTWNPQLGATGDLPLHGAYAARVQAALIDVADAPATVANESVTTPPPPTAELSRWPGIQARIALLNSHNESGFQIGAGGLIAPHRTAGGTTFNTWAGTFDLRTPVFAHNVFEGTLYRGQALGGLGGGLYKDFVYRSDGIESYFRILDDAGGWAQWKQRVNERLEFNEAIGIDEVPANQLRPYAIPAYNSYYNLARNRTITGNVIYSPSAYLQFSLEYRRLETSPVTAPTEFSDVLGFAAGYKF